jgi:DNA-binding CsgD family transcriptional regulator
MADRGGFAVVKELLRELSDTCIVVCPAAETSRPASGAIPSKRASALFVLGRVLAPKVGDDLGPADNPIRPKSPEIASKAPASDRSDLTPREHEILDLLARGHPMKQIAYRLGITYRTVLFHKYKMMGRLGIRTNAALMAYALRGAATPFPGRAISSSAA